MPAEACQNIEENALKCFLKPFDKLGEGATTHKLLKRDNKFDDPIGSKEEQYF